RDNEIIIPWIKFPCRQLLFKIQSSKLPRSMGVVLRCNEETLFCVISQQYNQFSAHNKTLSFFESRITAFVEFLSAKYESIIGETFYQLIERNISSCRLSHSSCFPSTGNSPQKVLYNPLDTIILEYKHCLIILSMIWS